MRRITLPNGFMHEAASLLREGKSVKLHITGDSMLPFIHGGEDVVEIEPCPATGDLPEWCCPFYCWEGRYMIHRYVGREGEYCLMLGDGNIARIEKVRRDEITGLLRRIYRPDGSVQDCTSTRWLKRGEWWYRLRPLRRWLLPAMKILNVHL